MNKTISKNKRIRKQRIRKHTTQQGVLQLQEKNKGEVLPRQINYRFVEFNKNSEDYLPERL